jgi:hypothetical protein
MNGSDRMALVASPAEALQRFKHVSGVQARVQEVSPYRRTNRYMCLYDTTAAITASTTTLRVVVHRDRPLLTVNLRFRHGRSTLWPVVNQRWLTQGG